MMSNPETMQSLMQNSPMGAQVAGNPQMASMLQNPEFLRQMADPANIQAMMQLQQATEQLRRSGLLALLPGGAALAGMPAMPGMPGAPPPGAATGTGAPAAAMPNLSAMISSAMGGLGAPPAAAAAAQPPDELYRRQLEQMESMGFTDRAANIAALQATGGSVNAAIERLL